MPLPNPQKQQIAYLLRLTRSDDASEWRVFMQDVHTGEQRGFRDLDALVAFFSHSFHALNDAATAARMDADTTCDLQSSATTARGEQNETPEDNDMDAELGSADPYLQAEDGNEL